MRWRALGVLWVALIGANPGVVDLSRSAWAGADHRNIQAPVRRQAQPPMDHALDVDSRLQPSLHDGPRRNAHEVLQGLPPYFVENRGQMDRRSPTTSRDWTQPSLHGEGIDARGGTERAGAAETAGAARNGHWSVAVDFDGGRDGVRPQGEVKTDAVISYFKGPRTAWKTGLPTFGTVVYRDVWPGIDVSFSGASSKLKYEFIVHPGADSRRIRLRYRGALSVEAGAGGALEVVTPWRVFEDERPSAYQMVGGSRRAVAAAYAVRKSGSDFVTSFRLASYDRSRTLVVDPAVFLYCGFIGGFGDDWGLGIAVDSTGCAYVAGRTIADERTFPVTVGPDLTFNEIGLRRRDLRCFRGQGAPRRRRSHLRGVYWW